MPANRNIFRQHTCPWWFLFTFDNPLRRLYQNPDQILAPYISAGDRAVDLGCGMGYFTIPLARLVGETGSVVAVDLQPEMLAGVERRADRAGVLERIRTHRCQQERLGLELEADFVLAFWMVHEVHDLASFLGQIRDLLVPGGKLLVAEPYLHVPSPKFLEIKSQVLESGFKIRDWPKVGFSRSLLAIKES